MGTAHLFFYLLRIRRLRILFLLHRQRLLLLDLRWMLVSHPDVPTEISRQPFMQHRRPEILFEGHAKNMRRFMGIDGLNPKRTAHQRRLKKNEEKTAEAK